MKVRERKTLWELTEGHRLRYGMAILAMFCSNIFFFGVPLVAKLAIDAITGEVVPNPSPLDLMASEYLVEVTTGQVLLGGGVAVVILTLIGGAFLYLRGRWAQTASEAIVRALRDRLYSHLHHLPCEYHDKADTGDLVQRCSSDVETVRVFLSAQIVEIGRAVLLLLTVFPILLWLDWRMAVASTVLFPIIIAFAVIFFRKVKALFLETDEAEAEMTAVLQENLTGIRVVRAFARQDFECEKFAAKNECFRDKNYRLIRLLAAYWGTSDFFCVGQIGVALMFGAWLRTDGAMSVGTLFAFMSYIGIVIWPVRHMGRVITDTGKAIVSLGRLHEVLGSEPETTPESVAEPPMVRGEIEFDHVDFAFGDGEPALRDVSFHVRAGETLALVGPPGSGKSTIAQLLLRLYDYDGTGSIRLDGVELATFERKHVRSQIGVVLQEPFLYSKTIAANLRVGRASASHEDLIESATAASIHESIEEFEHGYQTLVGERGVTLSGGQRQRTALARALLKDPPVLILDDALSAVDTRTEADILAALKSRAHRRTTVIIAHRLSTILHADRILVLEEGRIVQDGNHDTLVGEEGPYRRLWKIQGALEEDLAREAKAARAEGSAS